MNNIRLRKNSLWIENISALRLAKKYKTPGEPIKRYRPPTPEQQDNFNNEIKNGYILAEARKGLVGTTIKLPSISVGATENVIIAASYAKGTTYIKNCACEPEIKNLTDFLKKMGVKISWISKRKIKIIKLLNNGFCILFIFLTNLTNLLNIHFFYSNYREICLYLQ